MSVHLGVGESVTKTQLTEEFDIIGLLPYFATSTCLMAIDVLQTVPESCDCSSKTTETLEVAVKDHGVKSHGDTMQITQSQSDLIEQLIRIDAHLYKLSEEIFFEAVERVNTKYSVKLCMM